MDRDVSTSVQSAEGRTLMANKDIDVVPGTRPDVESVQPPRTRRERRQDQELAVFSTVGDREMTREVAPETGASPLRRRRRGLQRHPLAVEEKATSSRFRHFDAIDGARGIAILSVLLYHSGWSERGLFGVDMFFVVSGFLITLLLLREAARAGRIRIGSFYARRARRLLPPLVLTLLLTLLMLWRFGSLDELRTASGTALASLLQVANWYQIGTNAAYWESTGQIIAFGQMWSLSVTEQFYLVWPLLIAGIWVFARRRIGAVVILLGVVAGAAAVVAPLLSQDLGVDRLYLGTDARAVSFVVGGLCAAILTFVMQRNPRWAGEGAGLSARVVITLISVLSLVAVVGVSLATESYRELWLYQGGFAVVSVLIGLFITTLCLPGNAISRAFTWKPFRAIGVLSYSMFLMHLPVYWAISHLAPELPPLALFVLGTIATWLVSTVVHYVFAEPLRTRQWRALSAVIAILVGFGLVVVAAIFLPMQKLASPIVPENVTGAAEEGFMPADADISLAGPDGTPLRVALIGDSIASNMFEALTGYRSDIDAVDISFGGCGIFDADSVRAADGWVFSDTANICWPWKDKLRSAEASEAIDVYIVHNRYDAHDQLFEGDWIGPSDPEWADRYRSQLEELLAIGDESENPPLILLANDFPDDLVGAERLDVLNAINESVLSAHPNVRILDFASAKCPNGTCPMENSAGEALYVDGVHFGPAGLVLVAPWLATEIDAALKPNPTQ